MRIARVRLVVIVFTIGDVGVSKYNPPTITEGYSVSKTVNLAADLSVSEACVDPSLLPLEEGTMLKEKTMCRVSPSVTRKRKAGNRCSSGFI